MIEHIKSVILFLLVASSLLLTYALWTYQPDFEPIEQTDYIDESKLDGEERTVREVISPNQIIFHDYQVHKQLIDKQQERELYEEILTWQFTSELHLEESHDVLGSYFQLTGFEQFQSLEILYPVDVPMNLINQLFAVNLEQTNWGDLTFNRLFLHVQEQTNDVRVVFASDNEEQNSVLVGEIQSTSVFDRLKDVINRQEGIVQLNSYDFGSGVPIYLPIQEIPVTSHTLLTDNIDPILMRNALFRDPSVVRTTSSNPLNESIHYTDGTRALKTYSVFNDQDERMEFINPLSSETEPSETMDMIRRSLSLTNDHLGWTNDFILDDIQERPLSSVLYRMYFNNYPIYDEMNYTVMEQVWGNNELNKLKRPLFKINNITYERTTLPSGDAVYETLQNVNNISLSSIEQVRVGYTLTTRPNSTSNVLSLEPEWYIKLSNSWLPLSDYSDQLMNQGVE